jgi:excinuclease UvrABC ATPase subunit
VGTSWTIGLGYLSLGRETSTLTGGESQRVKMIRTSGTSLTEMLYILDGAERRAARRATSPAATALLMELRDKGNTCSGVVHDPDVMGRSRSHQWTSAPRAGTNAGGVFEGRRGPQGAPTPHGQS